MQLQLHALQERSPSNLSTSSNSNTTQLKLHKNMDEDTWTCTSNLSMRLHIRWALLWYTQITVNRPLNLIGWLITSITS